MSEHELLLDIRNFMRRYPSKGHWMEQEKLLARIDRRLAQPEAAPVAEPFCPECDSHDPNLQPLGEDCDHPWHKQKVSEHELLLARNRAAQMLRDFHDKGDHEGQRIMKAALSALRPAWQPIESAPKDSKAVLVYVPSKWLGTYFGEFVIFCTGASIAYSLLGLTPGGEDFWQRIFGVAVLVFTGVCTEKWCRHRSGR